MGIARDELAVCFSINKIKKRKKRTAEGKGRRKEKNDSGERKQQEMRKGNSGNVVCEKIMKFVVDIRLGW